MSLDDSGLGGVELGNNFGYTQQGYAVMVAENVESPQALLEQPTPINVLHWKSQKASSLCTATFSAEFLAAVATFDSVQFFGWLCTELVNVKLTPDLWGPKIETIVLTDCASLVDYLQGVRQLPKEKRNLQYLAVLREAMRQGSLRAVVHIMTEWQIADPFTKAMPCDFLVRVLETNRLVVNCTTEGRIAESTHQQIWAVAQHKPYVWGRDPRGNLNTSTQLALYFMHGPVAGEAAEYDFLVRDLLGSKTTVWG